MKWEIVGYYIDDKGSWTMYKNNDGKTKMVKGIK